MNDFPVDLVVTYVDSNDLTWKSAVSQFNSEVSPKRYRSWDTLKHWFRGIEKHMQFIRDVHLVVSNIEQVPKWLDQSKIHVVLHKEIIPERLLPTFNSTTIEMFLHKIPGLAEHFIYSNDDMMPINNIDVYEFFQDGLPVYELVHRSTARNIFRMQCKNSYKLAAKLSEHRDDNTNYFYIRHSIDPMLKSICDEVHEKAGDQICKKCTKFREPFNFTQYLFPDYAVMTQRAVIGRMSLQYATTNDQQLQSIIDDCKAKVLCINDSSGIEDFDNALKTVNDCLERRFPEKSRFEI